MSGWRFDQFCGGIKQPHDDIDDGVSARPRLQHWKFDTVDSKVIVTVIERCLEHGLVKEISPTNRAHDIHSRNSQGQSGLLQVVLLTDSDRVHRPTYA